MTPMEALQWADKNCQPEVVARLRSRAAVDALAVEVRRMRNRIERLRGALKTASGRFFEANDLKSAEDCMTWAGDMEPPLMGPNASLTGGR
jgi:hypothetical protein